MFEFRAGRVMEVAPMHSRTVLSSSCHVLLVFPRFFADTFWSFRVTCEVLNVRHPAPPLGLITVAALLPSTWQVRLIDCNVETLTDDDIAKADLVMTGGMFRQRPDALAIVERCRACGTPVAVGGPDATSSPEYFRRANFLVIGEAEPVMAQFIAAWNNGEREGEFSAEKFTADVTASPLPRFDLLNFGHYLFVNVQYSRGCPFNCEFCDIIELYGRVPRTKTIAQVLAELDRLYALGYRGHIDFVDDNLVGNKKALRQFLPALIAWQKAHGFPFEFSTEASVNIADDDRVLEMLRNANFFTLFIGIESPDTETLIAARKKQNTRRNLVASINKIYASGMSVMAGFILGFDGERKRVAEGIVDCIEESAIPVCMVGLLSALPNTQLTRRLAGENRLGERYDRPYIDGSGDHCTDGLNFVTARPRREILADYLTVLERIYTPEAFFARVRAVARRLQNTRSVLSPSGGAARDIYRLTRVLWAMTVRQPSLASHVLYTLGDCAWHNAGALRNVVKMMALYLHLGPFAGKVAVVVRKQIDQLDREAQALGAAPPVAIGSQRDLDLQRLPTPSF
jgi:radical SAM superfamily enzyme YgiQ (UPF0313 family)